METLQDRVVVITGGTSGIGVRTAEAFGDGRIAAMDILADPQRIADLDLDAAPPDDTDDRN